MFIAGVWQGREQGHLCRASPASSGVTNADLELNQSQSCCRPCLGQWHSQHLALEAWDEPQSHNFHHFTEHLSNSCSAGLQHVALVSPVSISHFSFFSRATFFTHRKHQHLPNNHKEGRSETSQEERYQCLCREGEESLDAQGVSPTPRYCSGLQKGLTFHKQESTKGKRTVQRSRHPAEQTVPGALFSSAPLAEKPLSLLPFSCMRLDACFPKSHTESSPAPAPCHQEGRRRAGALCLANPGDTCPWGPAIAKPQLSCSDPPWLLPHPSWGRKGSCQGAGSVPTSLSSETELWEAGWRDEARNRCRQAWPLSPSLSSEWSQQKEHLATLALPHPACSCLSPWTYGSKLCSCIRDDFKQCC